jgi:hypothetical protein
MKVLGVALLVAAAPVAALEVWVSVGEHGEPSFSDAAPAAGAGRRVEVVGLPAPAQDAAGRSLELTQALLESAAALEQSRLLREAARERAREAAREERARDQLARREERAWQAAAAEPRYVVGWPWRPHHRPPPMPHGPRPGTGPVVPTGAVAAPTEPPRLASPWR